MPVFFVMHFGIKFHIEKFKIIIHYMLSKNVLTTFSVEENDFFVVSGRSGFNFNSHSMHPLMKNRVISLKDFCAASTKALVEQMLLTKSKVDH